MFGCFSETPCETQCKCTGTGSNSELDCSGNSWKYFPQLTQIPLSVGKLNLKNNNIGYMPHDERQTAQ